MEPLELRYSHRRAEFDRTYIFQLMMETNGAINKASRISGLSKVTLLKKIRAAEVDAATMRVTHAYFLNLEKKKEASDAEARP